eukprot:11209106-Lingulodinium_polyedra.AAC.1
MPPGGIAMQLYGPDAEEPIAVRCWRAWGLDATLAVYEFDRALGPGGGFAGRFRARLLHCLQKYPEA